MKNEKNNAAQTGNFKRGQIVRNQYGETRTVLFQANDCQVYVKEECNAWYHPTKLYPVK